MPTDRYQFPPSLRNATPLRQRLGLTAPKKPSYVEQTIAIVQQFAERLELGAAGDRVCKLIAARQFHEARIECDAALRDAHEELLNGKVDEVHRQLVRRNLIRLSIMLQDLEATRFPTQ